MSTEELDIYSYEFLSNYIQDNVVGLGMLLLVGIIIYVVDHIGRINAMLYAIPSPIPQASPISKTDPLSGPWSKHGGTPVPLTIKRKRRH